MSPAPLSDWEERRFRTEMAKLVAEKITTAGRFRISADQPGDAERYQEIASLAAQLLGRPLQSHGNGREWFIAPREDALDPPGDRT